MANNLTPSLDKLATRIRAEERAMKAAITSTASHAMAAGDLLIEAKKKIKHGDWLPWLAVHCEVSEKMATVYMRLAKNRSAIESNPQHVAELTIRKALALVPPSASKDVVEVIPPNPSAVSRPEDAFSIEALPVKQQEQIARAEAILEELEQAQARVAFEKSSGLDRLKTEYGRDGEAEALEAFATSIIDACRDAYEDPEMIRDALFEVAELLERCEHPVRWSGYLRAKGKEIASESSGQVKRA